MPDVWVVSFAELLPEIAIKPLASRIARVRPEGQAASVGLLALLFSFVFASALFTEMIGIHALFGAFLAGVCMPPDFGLRQFLRERRRLSRQCCFRATHSSCATMVRKQR